MMNLYFELSRKPVFSIEDLAAFYIKKESARSAVSRLLEKGMILRIRRNLYTAVSAETRSPVANRYQIASAVTETSYVSHHSAMEYFGITDQVFYEMYVGSDTRFSDFFFDGYHYKYVSSNGPFGIETVDFSGNIRITDREKTVLDCIKDMDRIAGAEEVIANVGAITFLKEEKLVDYLARIDNQFLYQKTGCIFERLNNKPAFSENFYDLCREKAGKSTRYLTRDYIRGTFDAKWNLVVPDSIFELKNGDADAEI